MTQFQALKSPFEVQVLETESQSSILKGRALALQMDQCNHYRSMLLVIKVGFYKMMYSSPVPVAWRHALECVSVQQLWGTPCVMDSSFLCSTIEQCAKNALIRCEYLGLKLSHL